MNTKNNRRSQGTKELLRQSLLEILNREDILDVTVSELCQTAGVNRSTFYSHYQGIADVMEELQQQIGQDLLQRFPRGEATVHSLFSLDHLVTILSHIQDHKFFYRAYLGQSTSQNQLDWAFGQLLDRYVRPMMHKLQVNDQAIAYYFTFFRAGLEAVIRQWVQLNCQEKPETVAGYLRDMLIHPRFPL